MTTILTDMAHPKLADTAVPFADSLDQLLAGLAYVDLRVRWAVARAWRNGLNPEDEFRGLYISDEQINVLLGYELGHHLWASPNGHSTNGITAETANDWAAWPTTVAQARCQWQARTHASRTAGIPMLFDQLAQRFALTPTEEDSLLIALAPEIDPRYERFFAYLQDDVTRKRPSVDLILNLLTDSFTEKLHLRRLFTDNGRLIQARLLVRFADSGVREPTLLSHTVRPAASLVENLLGHTALDTALADCAQIRQPDRLLSTQRLPADFLEQLRRANQLAQGQRPLFAFIGAPGMGKQEAAAHLAYDVRQPLLTVNLAALAESEIGLSEGLALVLRDGRLLAATLYLTGWDSVLIDGRPPETLFRRLLTYPETVIVAGQIIWQPTTGSRRLATSRLSADGDRPVFAVPFIEPDYERRLELWHSYLAAAENVSLDLRQVANHFRFTPGQIEDVVTAARDMALWRAASDRAQAELTTSDLFAASRTHSNQKLATLASKIQPRYRWQDIVLPADTLAQLREMVNMVRQRPFVYGNWGFDRKLALGKGLNALFAGESGTGKTMAADIMAGELGLDLYKVDLSLLVSKYIGETEKNLERIFTEAATSNAILFFDEADAIFGKRSEVKDSHDRYANIEISYLLQRMEAYDGVVILATNLRANLDEAFTRRLHFAIEFPFPEAADRERIWRVNFPSETPLAADVDFAHLAETFRLAGGNIRNIILAAAFLAAEAGDNVSMAHLLHATRREYQKMGRLIDERLFNG